MKLPKPIKRGDAFRIEFMRNGKRYSATRDTEKECTAWVARKLLELEANEKKIRYGDKPHYPLRLLLEVYYENVGKHKKSKDRVKQIISNFNKNFAMLAERSVHDITPEMITKQYRNIRAKQVKQATLLREMAVLSACYSYAVKEMFLLKENPMLLVSKPPTPKPRNRRISESEIDLILKSANYEKGLMCETRQHYVAWMFLFAIETAMREGEILSIQWPDIHHDFIRLHDTKNGESRDVPLTKSALLLLELLPKNTDKPIPIKDGDAFKTAWKRILQKSEIKDLHFHDTRHEAITRFVQRRKIPVEILAKITGHKTIGILINTYYNPTASEIARMLDD